MMSNVFNSCKYFLFEWKQNFTIHACKGLIRLYPMLLSLKSYMYTTIKKISNNTSV